VLTFLFALGCSLQAPEEVDAAIAKFRATMAKTNSPAERSGAILDLGRIEDDKTLAVLTPLVTTGDFSVRKSAIQAISRFYDHRKKVLAILLKSLQANQGEPVAVAAALEVLPGLEDPTVIPVIQKYFADNSIFVSKAAVMAVARLPQVSSVEPLLQTLKAQEKVLANAGSGSVGPVIPSPTRSSIKPNPAIRKDAETLIAAANASLAAITKQEFKTAAEWQKWWDANKATFKVEQ
jgi:HEAT repeat protein